jgi:isoleucyl-tRNA synthetase
MSPILCFTTEEVWSTRFPEAGSVHLLEWPEIDSGWADEALGARWDLIRASRVRVTESIEPLRREKTIGSSLEAKILYPEAELGRLGADAEALSEIYIVSELEPGPGDSVEVLRTGRSKCGRCWRHRPEVPEDGDLCARCEEVVSNV